MRRTFNLLLLSFLCTLAAFAAPGELKEKLAALKGITSVEQLESDVYPEKYLVRITQPVDPKNPEAGTFTQRCCWPCRFLIARPLLSPKDMAALMP